MAQTLHEILLHWMRPTRSGLDEAIARIVSGDDTLTHLNLRNTGMTDQDLKKLRRAIRSSNNQTLVSLDLSCNLLTDEGLKELADWPNLTDLNISANNFGKAGISSLCKNTGIQRLTARQNKLDHEAAALLSQQTQYEALDLGSNNLEDLGVKALAQCPNLLILDISDNHITDDGIAEFATHSKLTHLVARINKITDDGLNRCLSHNTKLTYLDMGNNLLVCPTSIGEHPSLLYFKGYANQINDAGAAAIAKNPGLKVALLNVNRITSAGAQLLHAAGYRFLDLSGNRAIQDRDLQSKVFLSDTQYQQCHEEFPPVIVLRETPSSPAPQASGYTLR
ncbi:MAG: hypothetical protein KBB94_05920 [Legionellaceae bacterium]|nr:hypothetical protein [Legionellaceae bacterium]MBP9775868.1 hypothetical protein [Legionellaceae bacterium]